jgi:hypothetical protein
MAVPGADAHHGGDLDDLLRRPGFGFYRAQDDRVIHAKQ